MGNRVERVRTDISEPQMAQGILEGWKDLFGDTPTKEQVSLVLAQNDLETGHRKSMWNFNVGNITTDGKGQYDYFDDLKTNEQTSPGVWKKMNLKYRAYPTLKDGVKDYLKFLSANKRYAGAWQHIVHPDPVAFSKALKQSGYYTANEEDYTKGLVGRLSQISKSKSYEDALNGKVPPPKEDGSMVAKNDGEQENFFQKYLSKFKDKGHDIFDQIAGKESPVATAPTAPAGGVPSDVTSILNSYIQQIKAAERSNKRLYQKFLPSQRIVIAVKANTYTDAVEFSRVLCTALDEELMAKAFIHTDHNNVEVECVIPGPEQICFAAVEQLTVALASAFKNATVKLGGIDINTKFIVNKKSSYQEITSQAAQIQYRKFLLKFV